MPNYCENWLRLSGNPETLTTLASKPLELDHLESPPKDLSSDEYFDWVYEHWGTKWIVEEPREDSTVTLRKQDDGSYIAKFMSAWAPPLPFYNAMAVAYPDVIFEYEYAEWGVGFAGYGVGAKDGEPNHFSYESRADLKRINDSRKWNIVIWNPHFCVDDEYEEMADQLADEAAQEANWDEADQYYEDQAAKIQRAFRSHIAAT